MSISDEAIERIRKSNCNTDETFFQAVKRF